MICSNDFVWLHFPKCAGTKIELLFKNYFGHVPGLEQDAVTIDQDPEIRWHDSIAMRSARNQKFELGNRTVICSFRRLPSWLESRYSFEVRRNPSLNHSPESLLHAQFLEMDGRLSNADAYCEQYLPRSLLNSARVEFIRVEFFKEDFKRVFGSYLDLAHIPETAIRSRVNSSKSAIPRKIRKQLHSKAQEVYQFCPRWEYVERLAFPV